jgi:hypothetical protein
MNPKSLIVFLVLATLAGTCEAQILRRNRVSDNCANGQCQVPTQQFATPVRSTVAAVAAVQPVRSAVRGVYESVSEVRGYGSTGSQTYGSSGSQAVQSYGSSGSQVVQSYVVTYSGCQCGCGSPTCQCGMTAASSMAPVASSSVAALGFKSRKQSRQVIMEAADKGLADGSLTANEAQAIRLAARSPRMLNRIEDLILEKAQSSGAYSFALDRNGDVIKSAIDWEAIGDFILKIAPIIFKLIEMFAMDATMPATVSVASRESEQFNYVATVGFEFTGA